MLLPASPHQVFPSAFWLAFALAGAALLVLAFTSPRRLRRFTRTARRMIDEEKKT